MATKRTTAVPDEAPTPTNVSRPSPSEELELRVDVEPRKPRVVWQGMDRSQVATSVPTQVVEIVRPGRAIERVGDLTGLSARAAAVEEDIPENRLIWTNDNLVALETLLDEREPKTKDYRYRGKVDLIYIDPPFMVNNDFLADNAIDIPLDEDAGVQARKEPSLVEILAYKDTWRQGLDSFLLMMRERLILLKKFLAPTGSIYVHLDWHAAHYIKVLMDELFGYENFLAEIAWKRANARAGSQGVNHIHDTILAYGASSRPFHSPIRLPHDPDYVRSHYRQSDERGRYRLVPLNAPGLSSGATGQPWRGYMPPKGRHWSHVPEQLEEFVAAGLVQFPTTGKNPELKQYLNDYEGIEIQSIWVDIPPVNPQAAERLGFPTQKPVALLDRIISMSCPPDGIVLDCFLGSGTTAEAAERLGRRWIGIDNGKYGIHLTRKRLIQLQGQPRPADKRVYDYVECRDCKNIERKEKPQRKVGPFNVRPFTVENMGVYQRAAEWQGFQQHRSAYRDEMIKVFGGEPVEQSMLLHGKKGNSWIHIGPLDASVSSGQVWQIAREAQATSIKAVTILSADFDTLSFSDKDEIRRRTGVTIMIRVIPASAIDEVKRRLDLLRANPDVPVESMAIPAFYAPLSIVLGAEVDGRNAHVKLQKCEVDIDSFIASQKPLLKPITEGMSETARKKAKAELEKWQKREKELLDWLKKAKSWQAFIDFWAIDWNYGRVVGEDGKPIFVTEWQSFRTRGDEEQQLLFGAKFSYPAPGKYRIAARVTDVFGNDGIATAEVEVKR